jgi:hypothetical protein
MRHLVIVTLGVLLLAGCKERELTPEEAAFQQKFDREAVLVKTCGFEPGVATAVPIKVYRFENELWFYERGGPVIWSGSRLRRIDGKVETVCDLLDVDAAHREPPDRQAPKGGRHFSDLLVRYGVEGH